MKKQKICIIGGSLTGLATAISLSRLNCNIDLICGNFNGKNGSSRTIAVSDSNFNFLKKLNISKSIDKEFWPCSGMKLYSETESDKFSEIFVMNNESAEKKILYMVENMKIMHLMLSKIKKIQSISIKKNEDVSEIKTSGLFKSIKINNKDHKYNLVIVCSGNNSHLVKNIFKDRFIKKTYNEESAVTIIKHNYLKNNIVRQIFLNNGILAFLPISNNKTSVVWSIKKNIYKNKDLLIKNKTKFYANKYYKKIIFQNNIEYKDLVYLIRNKYYQNRILLFGDALHVIHPFVGQGFNMTLRDLASLEKILFNKINLGLDIGSSDILSEFADETKPRNFAYSLGINFIKDAFTLENEIIKEIRNNMFKSINKSSFIKNKFFNFANEGLKF